MPFRFSCAAIPRLCLSLHSEYALVHLAQRGRLSDEAVGTECLEQALDKVEERRPQSPMAAIERILSLGRLKVLVPH